MKAADPRELQRLIDLIDLRVAAVPPQDTGYDLDTWRAHWNAGEQILQDLVEQEGARYVRGTGDASALKLAGIRTSCTGGQFGLLSNWQNAARKKISAVAA